MHKRKKPEYNEAVWLLSNTLNNSIWEQSIFLANWYDKPKEETLDDLLESRRKTMGMKKKVKLKKK